MLSTVRWLAFAWGCLALCVMVYYAWQWLPQAQQGRSNEMALGFVLGAFYGWPAWLALPSLAFLGRRTVPRWQFFSLLAPAVAAACLYVAAQLISGRWP
jgi:hypothetical protein